MNIIIILFVVWAHPISVHNARQRMGHYFTKNSLTQETELDNLVTILLLKVSTFAHFYCVIVVMSKTLI